MTTTTYKLTSVAEAIHVGTQLCGSWFRGQPEPYDNLTPKIFRPEWDDIWKIRGDELELIIIDEFRRRAPGLSEKVPHPKDHLSWLFYMQHHGAPTRLLDWTESILAALYFAVAQKSEANGELWAMQPDTLNKRAGVGLGFPLLNSRVLRYLANEPLMRNRDRLAKRLKLTVTPDCPVALRPATSFPRMVAQLSTFTIHASPTHGKPLSEVLPEEEYLVRYLIPASRKPALLIDLKALGITRRSLFPDLDSLSASIVYEYQTIVGYTPPKPPKCGGPV